MVVVESCGFVEVNTVNSLWTRDSPIFIHGFLKLVIVSELQVLLFTASSMSYVAANQQAIYSMGLTPGHDLTQESPNLLGIIDIAAAQKRQVGVQKINAVSIPFLDGILCRGSS